MAPNAWHCMKFPSVPNNYKMRDNAHFMRNGEINSLRDAKENMNSEDGAQTVRLAEAKSTTFYAPSSANS